MNYVPYKAIQENTPKKKKQTLSFYEYVKRYRTTEERDGWERHFLPEKQTTIYVRKYGHKYREALRHREWMYITEVMDLSEYAQCDLAKMES